MSRMKRYQAAREFQAPRRGGPSGAPSGGPSGGRQGNRPPLPSIDVIRSRLTDRLEELVGELYPAAQMIRQMYHLGSLDGEPGQSLRIFTRPPRRGQWRDFASGDFGDPIDLIRAARCGGDTGKALVWARQWLGLASESLTPEQIARERKAAEDRALKRQAAVEADREKRRGQAKALYLAARPLVAGDPVWRYLAGRGIDLGTLPQPPGALRYHPDCWNSELRRGLPAMVAIANDTRSGAQVAIHRTYLEEIDGRWVKAQGLTNAKLTLGDYAGSVIALSKGQSGKPWKQAPAGDRLAITEGIEDGLTVAIACPDLRVAAALAVDNYANVQPPTGAIVTLVDQHDVPLADGRPHPAEAPKRRAIDAWLAAGHRVHRVDTAAFGGAKDVNDLLTQEDTDDDR